MLIFTYVVLAYSIYSVMLILIRFELIKVFKADEGLVCIMKSTRLWYLWIHFTLIISCCSYNWYKLITSTISCFSYLVPDLMRQSHKDFESVHIISKTVALSIIPSIDFIITTMSNLYAILYSSTVKIMRITRLHFIKD